MEKEETGRMLFRYSDQFVCIRFRDILKYVIYIGPRNEIMKY